MDTTLGTCALAGVEPMAYIRDVLVKLQDDWPAPQRQVLRGGDHVLGDFRVRTTVSGAQSAGLTGSAQLSEALEDNYREQAEGEAEGVRVAIEDIRRH